MSMTPSRRVVESLTLDDLAIDARIVTVRCNLCRRTTYFLASDLVTFYGGKTLFGSLFPRCSTCGRSDYMSVSHRLPDLDDDGALTIRRPKHVWQWTDETYWQDGKPPSPGRSRPKT